MNKLLSDDNISHQNNKNDSKISVSDDKSRGHTVIYGKSGRVVTLPPIETPKTRSLVKKEVHNFILIIIYKLHYVCYIGIFYILECR